MSVYDQFRFRKVKLLAGIVAAFIIFGIGAGLSRNYPSPVFAVLIFAGVAGLIVCAFLLNAGSRCPRCDTKMRDIPISCPSCGLNLTSVERSTPHT